MIRRLENWSVDTDYPFDPPELLRLCAHGEVYGDPSRKDGVVITTTRIVGVDGRNIRTKSGSTYRLGEPSESYRVWLREHRPDWDPESPVTALASKKKFATTHI